MPLFAAAPAFAQSELTGVWEPVNYNQDIELTDVFFVTPEIGYVSGAAGTILKTTDAGTTWIPLLGGDPASAERAVQHLRFVSPTTGWATQVTDTHTNLFRTSDGRTWEQVGSIEEHYADLWFTSATDGIFAHNKDVHRTRNGGRTWEKVYTCAVQAQIAGLARTLNCEITKIHFASATVGFAVGYHSDAVLVLRTDDGGSSWNAVTVIENEIGRDSGLFFLDESTGYLRVKSGKSYRTIDGGITWTGMPATGLSSNLRFADPEIGWSFKGPCVGMGCGNAILSYTIDGGQRWATRTFALPAQVKAFSLPRRDVAYAVGEHGMIYRYRSVPAGTPTAENSIAAVAMPPLANGIIEDVGVLELGLESIEAALAAAEAAPADPGAETDPALADAAWVEANYTDFDAFETTFDSVAMGLPAIGSKHRNLNLLLEGLKLLGDLTGQGSGLKDAFASLRQAKDPASVSTALLAMHAQLEAAKVSVTAFETGPSFGP
jgi:photosystem II stability/assembly factor-like uncharacterized protein